VQIKVPIALPVVDDMIGSSKRVVFAIFEVCYIEEHSVQKYDVLWGRAKLLDLSCHIQEHFSTARRRRHAQSPS
jgi:hypothetical protein